MRFELLGRARCGGGHALRLTFLASRTILVVVNGENMIRGLVFATLAVIALRSSESRADREKPGQTKTTRSAGASTAILDVRNLMSQKAFQSTGLVKLDATELETLNQ